MKKLFFLIYLLTISVYLTSCANSISVSERALIKAIFIDETDEGKVHVSIIVSENEPSANISDVKSTAEIYEGEAKTLEQALNLAQESQNSQAFYELNKLIIFGQNAHDNISTYLSYFKTEEIGGANLSVFLTELNHSNFADIKGNALEFIDICESYIKTSFQNTNKSRQILQLKFDEDEKFYGYLPLLKIQNNNVTGIEKLVVFNNGAPQLTLNNLAVEMMLLLSGELNLLDIEIDYDGEALNLITQNFSSQFETSEAGDMQITFSAKAHSATQNGKELYFNELSNALKHVNDNLSAICEEIVKNTTQNNNDFLNLNWYTIQNENKYLKNVEVKVNITP